jgi:hypothetical protein
VADANGHRRRNVRFFQQSVVARELAQRDLQNDLARPLRPGAGFLAGFVPLLMAAHVVE